MKAHCHFQSIFQISTIWPSSRRSNFLEYRCFEKNRSNVIVCRSVLLLCPSCHVDIIKYFFLNNSYLWYLFFFFKKKNLGQSFFLKIVAGRRTFFFFLQKYLPVRSPYPTHWSHSPTCIIAPLVSLNKTQYCDSSTQQNK